MSKSTAIMLLKRKVPDVLTEIPLRAIDIDYKGEEVLSLQEECLVPGWHFFYKGVRSRLFSLLKEITLHSKFLLRFIIIN